MRLLSRDLHGRLPFSHRLCARVLERHAHLLGRSGAIRLDQRFGLRELRRVLLRERAQLNRAFRLERLELRAQDLAGPLGLLERVRVLLTPRLDITRRRECSLGLGLLVRLMLRPPLLPMHLLEIAQLACVGLVESSPRFVEIAQLALVGLVEVAQLALVRLLEMTQLARVHLLKRAQLAGMLLLLTLALALGRLLLGRPLCAVRPPLRRTLRHCLGQ